MSQTLNYRGTRARQISLVFAASLVMVKVLHFQHAAWISFAVMMIDVGFDPGTTIHRAIHRFWGSMLALLLSFILIYLINLHATWIFIIIPVIIFFAFFSVGKYYAYPTIFTVTMTALGLAYYTPDNYFVDEFLYDYMRCTITALGICVVFEYFIFKKNNLSHLFYIELQETLIHQLSELIRLVTQKSMSSSQFLKLSVACNMKILELESFIHTNQHNYRRQTPYFHDYEPFHSQVTWVYQCSRQLYVMRPSPSQELIQQAQKALEQLTTMKQTLLSLAKESLRGTKT